MSLSVKDFIAGWGAGVCGLLVGHPADTVKVRQQVSRKSSVMNILLQTVKYEGTRGLYRGMLFPLLLAGVQNSVFFGIYGNTLRILQNMQGADANCRTCRECSFVNKHWHLNVYFAGFAAGFVHTFIACPVELVKVKIQIKTNLGDRSLNVKTCIKEIYHHSGINGFYHGLVATLYRDVPSYGMYVLIYEHLLSVGYSLSGSSSSSDDYSIICQLVSGGLAGTITWVSVTPLDVIKSRIQADDYANPKYKGMVDCFIQSYKNDGLKVFGRGFWIHALRGFPVNAATFVGYECILKMCKCLE